MTHFSRRWFGDRQPPPPENVHIIKGNGTIIPIDTVYQGRHDGIHHWAAVHPINYHPEHGDRIAVTLLPAHTAIEFTSITTT